MEQINLINTGTTMNTDLIDHVVIPYSLADQQGKIKSYFPSA